MKYTIKTFKAQFPDEFEGIETEREEGGSQDDCDDRIEAEVARIIEEAQGLSYNGE